MAREYTAEADLKKREKSFARNELGTIIIVTLVLFYIGMSVCMIHDARQTGLLDSFMVLISNPLYLFKYFSFTDYKYGGGWFPLMFMLMLLYPAIAFTDYTMRKLRLHDRLESLKGTAVWADITYLLHRYADWMGKTCSNVRSNLILGERMRIGFIKSKMAINVLIDGVSGSGKSRFYVKPNILQLNSCYIINDPSGGTMADTGEFLRRNGYDVRCINVKDLKNCNTYNPLKYCRTEADIRKISNTLVTSLNQAYSESSGAGPGGAQDPFWNDAMFALMTCLIALMTTKPKGEDTPYAQIPEIMGKKLYLPVLSNISRLTRMANNKWDARSSAVVPYKGARVGDTQNATANGSELALIFENLRKYEAERQGCDPAFIREPFALKAWQDFKVAPEKTSTTILMTVTTKLSMFNIEEVEMLTNSDTVDLDSLGTSKVALFLLLPTTDTTYNFLTACLHTQLFDMLMLHKGDMQMRGSHYYETPDRDFIKWFAKDDESEKDYKKALANCTYKKCGNGVKTGTTYKDGKEIKVSFDDSWYDIYDGNGNYLTRRQTLPMAEAFINGCKHAKRCTPRDVALPLHTRFILDEWGTTGEIPNFLTIIANVRKYNIGCDVIVQDYAQAKKRYKEDWETLDTNCPYTLFLGGNGVSNNEHLVKKIGQATKRSENNSVEGNRKASGSYNIDGRDLIQSAELGRLEYENCVVLIAGEQPLFEKKYDVVNHPNYKLTSEYVKSIGLEDEACVLDRSVYVINDTEVVLRVDNSDTIEGTVTEGPATDSSFAGRLGHMHFPQIKKISLPDTVSDFEKMFGVKFDAISTVNPMSATPVEV